MAQVISSNRAAQTDSSFSMIQSTLALLSDESLNRKSHIIYNFHHASEPEIRDLQARTFKGARSELTETFQNMLHLSIPS